jgi:hypothetical protein
MDSAIAKKYKDQDIVIDNKTAYIRCKFTNCHLIYMGGDYQLLNCSLENCQITITGEAGKTLAFMQTVGMIPGALPIPPAMAQHPDAGNLH